MNEMMFGNVVRKHFSWLEKEYTFQLCFENNSSVHPKTDGMVKYASNTTVIVIDSETSDAGVWFYRVSDGKKYDLDPIVIHEYLSTDDNEKKILLSTDPKDQSKATTLFNSKFLLAQPGWKSDDSTTLDKLELRLSNYAKWLKEHDYLCLTGDFSQWPKFYEYKILRTRADHLRRGKDELGFTRVKDSDGNWKLIKESIFKEKLEHVEKLKKEFPNK